MEANRRPDRPIDAFDGMNQEEVFRSSYDRPRLPPLSSLLKGSEASSNAVDHTYSERRLHQSSSSPVRTKSIIRDQISRRATVSAAEHANQHSPHRREVDLSLDPRRQAQQPAIPMFSRNQHVSETWADGSPAALTSSYRNSSVPSLPSGSRAPPHARPHEWSAPHTRPPGSDWRSNAFDEQLTRHPVQASALNNHVYEKRQWSPSANDWRERDLLFGRLWETFLTARRYNAASTHAGESRPLPSIHEGDVTTMAKILQVELDSLYSVDPRMAEHLSNDVQIVYDRLQSFERHTHSKIQSHPPTYSAHGEISASSSRDTLRYPGEEYRESYLQRSASGLPYTEADDRSVDYQAGLLRSRSNGYDNRFIHRSASDSPQGLMASSTSNSSRYPVAPYPQPTYASQAPMPKRVRKRRDEADQYCLSCSASETPEWRKGPTGPRTLCNACGLLFAKQCRKRESLMQAQGQRVKGVRLHGPERMTDEERESCLLELQMAVQARSSQMNPNVGVPIGTARPSPIISTTGRMSERGNSDSEHGGE